MTDPDLVVRVWMRPPKLQVPVPEEERGLGFGLRSSNDGCSSSSSLCSGLDGDWVSDEAEGSGSSEKTDLKKFMIGR